MNVGEVVDLNCIVLRIEIVHRLRALAWVENKRVVAGAANLDRRTAADRGRRVENDRPAMPVRGLFQITVVETIECNRRKDRVGVVPYGDDGVAVGILRKADVANRNTKQIDFI